VTRSGTDLKYEGSTFKFAGADVSWLGLSQDGCCGVHYPSHYQIDDALQTVAAMGGTVVRAHTLGISVGCTLCLEPTLNSFNSSAWDSIDYSIYKAGLLGLHLIIPLTDQYRWYHGGRCTFTDWAGYTTDPGGSTCTTNPGAEAFYTSTVVISDFETYISTLLNHVNSYTGVALKNDPAIMTWELGNELNTNPGSQWTEFDTWESTIAAYIKTLDTHHLIASAYAYHQKYSAELALSNIDMYTLHSNSNGPNQCDLSTTASDVKAAGKVFYVGEYDWQNHNTGSCTEPLASYLTDIETTAGVSGDLYWQLIPHDNNHGYLQHTDPNGAGLAFYGNSSDLQTRASDLRTHAYTMSGLSVPAYPAPPAPLITSMTQSGGHNVMEWRGAAGADDYTIQVSTGSSSGPWTTLTSTVDDNTDQSSGWQDSATYGGHAWYQIIPTAPDGTTGTASAAYQAQQQ
jgi:hypothetical protein